jgi:hypothetical protein
VSEDRRQQSNGTRHRLLREDVTEPLIGEHSKTGELHAGPLFIQRLDLAAPAWGNRALTGVLASARF